MRTLIVLAMALALKGECVRVRSDEIRAGDLARAVPSLASIDPAVVFGLSPQPGAKRVISGLEISRFALRQGASTDPIGEVCVEYSTRQVTNREIADAIRTCSGLPVQEIEVIEVQGTVAPEGVITCAGPQSIQLPAKASSTPFFWRGWIEYGKNHRFPLWARIRLSIERGRVGAARDLRAGTIVSAADVVNEMVTEIPSSPLPAPLELSAVVGRELRRDVSAGTEIRRELLTDPLVTRRGQNMPVLVINRNASLRLSASAESDAHAGEYVLLRNLETGKKFRAQVGADGIAVVRMSGEVR